SDYTDSSESIVSVAVIDPNNQCVRGAKQAGDVGQSGFDLDLDESVGQSSPQATFGDGSWWGISKTKPHSWEKRVSTEDSGLAHRWYSIARCFTRAMES